MGDDIVHFNATPLRGIFTAEGNADADNFRRDKKNFLNLKGQPVRLNERDFIQLLYSLTKPPMMVDLDDPN